MVVARCGMVLALVACAGCASRGSMPNATSTQVDLSRKNYRMVKANAIGVSSGFSLLGVLPLGSPRYTAAMTDLYEGANIQNGAATALTNVSQEESSLYLILFSIPKLTIRADVIEFTE